ncbi:unnamed protein product [Penicillium salamii]|nr:unnamed protein product [Penicillium salamii]CAG8177263.1 unnamed protein product [Penicillium salamii]CAG8368564.1 unnamed protein product [Penicillium salamii]
MRVSTHLRSPNEAIDLHSLSGRYCKRRKIKCHYNIDNINGKCNACFKSSTECHFDVPPDGVLRSDAYVATLETRIKSLETQLQVAQAHQSTPTSNHCLTPETVISPYQTIDNALPTSPQQYRPDIHPSQSSLPIAPEQHLKPHETTPMSLLPTIREAQTPAADLTMIEMVYGRTGVPQPEVDTLPALPSSNGARKLVDAAYFYTQARYCIVDWNQLGIWHQQREDIALMSPGGPIKAQTGAFFVWIIYAIGARLIPDPEETTEASAYFARARTYLPAVMSLQDMATVQALLCLVQYHFRAQTESPIWHLVGLALRLCVKLRYHRRLDHSTESRILDPYTMELRKRFFWCAYCFDRSLAIWSKLPFGISDLDIDIEVCFFCLDPGAYAFSPNDQFQLPVDIDDTCTDQDEIRRMQLLQNTAFRNCENKAITTMTAALHHLLVYRIRSKILTRYTGPHAKVPSSTEVQGILHELGQWKQQAPDERYSKRFPQQSPDRVQATYTQAVLLLIRPILMAKEVDPDLIGLCVEFAVEACSNAKTLSLNPQTPPDRITVYHCFYCGVTLLQCLAISPNVLTARRTHQAISACLSALSVYTRVLPTIAPFLRLFEDLSNLLVYGEQPSDTQLPEVRSVLNRIVSSDPSEASGILASLSGGRAREEGASVPTSETLAAEAMLSQPTQYDSILGGQSSVAFGAEFSLEMPLDMSPLYAPELEAPGLWTAPWIHPSSTEFI